MTSLQVSASDLGWRFGEVLTRRDGVLAAAIAISVLLHAILLSVQFAFPDALLWRSTAQPLEVVLVNAKTRDKPVKADMLAQANLDRGGNVDERMRSSTPLPVVEPRNPGRDLADAQKRAQQLDVRQQKLLAGKKDSNLRVPVEAMRPERAEDPAATLSGRDLVDLSLAALRLQAQIDKQIREYEERPRKKFIGSRAVEDRFAFYEDAWRTKIERIGTLNYPASARGKIYGSLRLTVGIKADGTVVKVELDRTSGLKVLDDAAYRIVKMAAPYAKFPADIQRDTDEIWITRTWFFGQGDKIWTE